MELKKSETLKYHQNLSAETTQKMSEIRKGFYELSKQVEALGNSRELALAFTHIESGLMCTIKHLCLVDPQAVLADL